MRPKIKLTISTLLASVLLAGCVTGCALFSRDATTEQKAQQIQLVARAASSMGAEIALKQHPEYRPQFETAYADLNTLVVSKQINGTMLRTIIAGLPVKELKSDTATIVIENATFLYDATVGDKLNIESQPYILAAATGIRDGLGIALGK